MTPLWITLAIAMGAFLAGFIVRDLIETVPGRPVGGMVDLTVPAVRGELRLGVDEAHQDDDEQQPVRSGGRLVW